MPRGVPTGYENEVVADDAGWARWAPYEGDEPGIGECPTCGAGHDPDGKDGLLMAMQCPVCEEPGCDECMPLGRGCACPSCEEEGD